MIGKAKFALGVTFVLMLSGGIGNAIAAGERPRPKLVDSPVKLDKVEVNYSVVRPPANAILAVGSRGGRSGYGDGGFNDNRGDRVDIKDASRGGGCPDDGSNSSGANPVKGNPVVLSTGDKVEPETDFVSSGEMPLSLERTYNHFWNYSGLFGKYWVSNFDYSLVWQTVGTDIEGRIFAQRPDGRRIKFARVGTTNRWNEDKPQPVAYILKDSSNGSQVWSMFAEDEVTEQYDGTGRPLSIRNAFGIGWTSFPTPTIF